MPIRKCPDCGKTVSTSASKCPHCGRGFTRWYIWVIGFVAAIAFAFMILLKFAAYYGQQ